MGLFHRLVTIALVGSALVAGSAANAQARIAVADLTCSETVRESFFDEAGDDRSSSNSSAPYGDSDFPASGQERIEYGELRKFTADIKGQLLATGFRVTQSRPYLDMRGDEKIFDIINRIKKGGFPGADYVLFGTVDSVEWRNDVAPLQGTDRAMLDYSLEVGVEFSLVNTRTYEVRAAFSAVGEGNDNKVWGTGARLTPNRARVLQEVSRSLADETTQQLARQFRRSPMPMGGGSRPRGLSDDDGTDGSAARAPAPVVKVYE
ncbi:hypothetical protein [Paraburkholderia sp. J63]|uniref:hypothetical protein n=1 Tax=Paraburkholderia sp. J63 TaxID=2805434 RepID=UPI002ABDB88B|nr:hypothetical protein [Paraburkholderia sp. J63]